LAHNGFLSGKLKLSVVSTGKYVIPYFIADFLKQNPGVELVLDVSNRTKVIESLEKNEIDFALVSLMPDNLNLKSIRLLENKLFLVGNSEFKKNQIKSSNFWESNSVIFREEGSATRKMMEQYLTENGINVKRRLELTSNEAVKQAVIAGIGCSIMPLIGLKNELDKKQIKILKTKDLPVVTNWELVWLEEKKLSPVTEGFVRFINKEKERIIHDQFDWYLNY
jgi:DNA-binding transcriptional LysR family regulator